MFSRFLSLGVVLSAICCNALFYAGEKASVKNMPQFLLWISISRDGTKGRYIEEDFETGALIWHIGTIEMIGTTLFHKCNGHFYVPMKPADNSMGLFLFSRELTDESGAEPDFVRINRDEITKRITDADKHYYFEPADHKKYKLDKRLFASH